MLFGFKQNKCKQEVYSKDEVNALIDSAMYYKPGDTFEIKEYTTLTGLLSANCTKVHFSIPVCKSMAKITKVTLDSFNLDIRHSDGGYIGEGMTTINGTTAIAKRTDNLLEIALIFNTAFSFTNNVPVSVAVNSLKISFS